MKLKKSAVNSPWVLALALFGIHLAIGIVFVAVLWLLNQNPNIASVSGIIAALIVGGIYTRNVGRIMPSGLRMQVAAIYIGIQVLLSIIFLPMIEGEIAPSFYPISAAVFLVYGTIVYFVLASVGKGQIASSLRSGKSKKI